MFITVLLFVLGLVLLIFGGNWFVDGAVGIAKRFHIPELLIGATVVSIGTTLPEVMVSANAAFQGMSDTAYGNAIGSIICNTALISAITMTFAPGKVSKKSFRTPVLFFYVSILVYCATAYVTGHFSRLLGFVLLAIFLAFMTVTIRQALRGRGDIEDGCLENDSVWNASENAENKQEGNTEDESRLLFGKIKINPTIKTIVLIVLGAAAIASGARLLVDNGILIAQALGVPQTVIALTFIALGTSLPELVTAITSLIKGHGSLSLGNIIGANLFNLVLVSGIATVIKPFDIPRSMLFGMTSSLILDIPVMIAVTLIMTVPALIKGKISRWQGITLLCIYAGFCSMQFFIT